MFPLCEKAHHSYFLQDKTQDPYAVSKAFYKMTPAYAYISVLSNTELLPNIPRLLPIYHTYFIGLGVF